MAAITASTSGCAATARARPLRRAPRPHTRTLRDARASARALRVVGQHRESRPVAHGTARRASSAWVCAVSANARNRSGWRATTSSVLRADASRSRRGSPRSAHRSSCAMLATSAAVRQRPGSAPSMRSRIPPCPAAAAAVLQAACRFIADSNRSPTTRRTASTSTKAIIHTALHARSRTAAAIAPRKRPIQAAAYTAVAASAP